jgi:hypothetical protein
MVQYGDVNTPVKRFSYYAGEDIIVVKPANNEEFFLITERIGINVVIYIVCVDKKGCEKWRHNAHNLNRITWLSPLQTITEKSTKNVVNKPVIKPKNTIVNQIGTTRKRTKKTTPKT